MAPLKTRKIADGNYEIVGTSLVVSRDEAPRYGYPQEWSIVTRQQPEVPLLTGKSKSHALGCLLALLEGCSKA
jgi:hypothetical protein